MGVELGDTVGLVDGFGVGGVVGVDVVGVTVGLDVGLALGFWLGKTVG